MILVMAAAIMTACKNTVVTQGSNEDSDFDYSYNSMSSSSNLNSSLDCFMFDEDIDYGLLDVEEFESEDYSTTISTTSNYIYIYRW